MTSFERFARRSPLAVTLLAGGLMMGTVLTGGAAAASPASIRAVQQLHWSAPKLVDSGGNLTGVSCPTRTFCLAVDSADNVFTYHAGACVRTNVTRKRDVGGRFVQGQDVLYGGRWGGRRA